MRTEAQGLGPAFTQLVFSQPTAAVGTPGRPTWSFWHARRASKPARQPRLWARQPQWRRPLALAASVPVPLPTVDWRRRCLTCLFIDRSDTVRARFAVGMFERLTGWNGCSQALVAWTCGVDAVKGTQLGLTTQASMFGMAASWQLRPHLFTSCRQRFEPDDIDRFDLLVCMDSSIQAEVLKQLSADRPSQPASYVQRICCLHDFLMYCSDEALLAPGSVSILDRQLRNHLRLTLPALRPCAATVAAAAAAGGASATAGSSLVSIDISSYEDVTIPAYMLPNGIPRPAFGGGEGSGSSDADALSGGSSGSSSSTGSVSFMDDWEHMMLMLVVCCVGLIRFLLDCHPDDLPDYDPL